MSEKNSAARLLSYLLPVAGALCLLVATVTAVYKAGFSTPLYILLAVGLLLFLTIFIRAERANLQYYLHVSFYSILVGGICVVLYLFAMTYTSQIDLTKQNLHSLSPGTRKYLENLDKDVTIHIFIGAGQQQAFAPIEDLYDRYTKRIKWDFEDPVKNPAATQEMGERVNMGDIFFVSEKNKKKISAAELDPQFTQMPVVAESVFTNALITVTRKSKPHIYFLTGHGEIPITEQRAASQTAPQPPSAAALCKALKDRGIETDSLDLARSGKIPDDADLIVIAGPQRDLFDPEVAALRDFLKKGGKLLALLEAITPDLHKITLTNLRMLLSEYGIDAPDSLILDQMSTMLGVSPPIYPLFGTIDPRHPITRDLIGILEQGRSFVQAPTRPIRQGTLPAGMIYTDLVKSSDKSWTSPLDKLSDNMSPPPQADVKPVAFGAAVEATAAPGASGADAADKSKALTRIVVYGTSILGRDAYLEGNNLAIQLMFNTVDWLTQSEDMIAIPARKMEETPIILDVPKARVILVIAVILLPAGLFFGGVSYSVMRRRR